MSFEPTADLCDKYGAQVQVCSTRLLHFGARRRFAGPIRTAQVERDNGVVRRLLSEPGNAAVLVIDGGGVEDCALVGDMLAGMACAHGWAGILINGAVRDTARLSLLDIGIVALGANPRPPARTGRGSVDVPITFGGVQFTPGAFLVSDEDGVVLLSNRGSC